MLVRLEKLLDGEAVQRCRDVLRQAPWCDGRITAGSQSAKVKNNAQLAEGAPGLDQLRVLVLRALQQDATFNAAAIPRRIYPPLFNRYAGDCNAFGSHVDNAVRNLPDGSGALRTDLSCTLFLSAPDVYEGGELVIEDSFASHRIKYPAGDAVVYPSGSLHRVEPVTRGERLASFFWIESRIREDERRRMLFDLDLSIMGLRAIGPEVASAGATTHDAAVLKLTALYHNLMRAWAHA